MQQIRLKQFSDCLIHFSDDIYYCDPQPLYFLFQKEYGTIELEVFYFAWAFNEIADKICHDGHLYESVSKYFALNVSEFLHLFSVGIQDVKRYGGKILNPFSEGTDIAEQIRCFIN